MKKFRALMLVLILVFGLVACNNRSMNYIIKNEPKITGIVKKTNENAILIENEAGEYWVSLKVENQDSMTHFSIGDEVVVYYDGNIAESYPMQINTVYAITLQTPAWNSENDGTEENGTLDSEYSSTTNIIMEIIDRTKTEELFCSEAEEKFYEDETMEYYFNVIKSHYIIVTYNNGNSEDIVTALKEGRATINDLDKFGIAYHTQPRFISPTAMTMESRIKVPTGYQRTETESGTFQDFLRKYSVKEDGSPVLLYDGRKKENQSAHIAVLELPIENEDLQQCADSIMRMYAEYFYAIKQYDRISFHFVNGFEATYTKWRDGYRISFEGNDCKWIKSKEYDDSYETFVKYMRIVFAYAGTLSMEDETEEISLGDVKAGDVFLMGGSPGHVVMVLDVCESEQREKAFLLAQGYMPAQEFHILKNPAHENDPWYYENEITYPLRTPEYTFQEGSLKRLEY